MSSERNPFVVTKAEEFNHSYELLASLMQFKAGVADVLLSNTNVFLEGSRGSGKSMYLRILSLPVKATYDELAANGQAERLPDHSPFVGVYTKLNPTIFSVNEHESTAGYQSSFQQLFNLYCIECMVGTVLEAKEFSHLRFTVEDEDLFVRDISSLTLAETETQTTLKGLFRALRKARMEARHAMDVLPLSSDLRSQPDLLWQCSEIISGLTPFNGQRVHFLIDEFDSLSTFQQKIINSYLRKRDFPTTFKVACKKHKLTFHDVSDNPLNPSGDFARVELDDIEFGTSRVFSDYVIEIANKRLRKAGYRSTVGSLLGPSRQETREHVEVRYSGLATVTMLSSGIVRTFLELCRDIFSRCDFEDGEPRTATISIQDEIVKNHASTRWSSLSRDHSARAELQHLVEQVATLFRLKVESGAEKQIIRLEIIDYDKVSTFLRTLLTQALEYEALVQPNRERLQKNRLASSRGFLLHRLLCVHFRLAPTSRWDAEISASQLERLVLGDYNTVVEVAKSPTKSSVSDQSPAAGPLSLFHSLACPILGQKCPLETSQPHVGFLSCRLPKAGHIRDAISLFKEAFARQSIDGRDFQLLTAEDHPAQGDIACKVCHAYATSGFVLVELSTLSPSVAMELGLAVARKMPTYILFNSDEQPKVPEPFSSLEYFPYDISPQGVENLVEQKLLPQLSDEMGRRPIVLGPSDPPIVDDAKGVFVSLPGDTYHQDTILPMLRRRLEAANLGPVITESEGHALQDLQRACMGIASARYCIIDTTLGAPTRAMYLGLAQGYRKPFVNLVDGELDQDGGVFTNARSKSEVIYLDSEDLVSKLKPFFIKFGVEL